MSVNIHTYIHTYIHTHTHIQYHIQPLYKMLVYGKRRNQLGYWDDRITAPQNMAKYCDIYGMQRVHIPEPMWLMMYRIYAFIFCVALDFVTNCLVMVVGTQ
jgi:hypothetical protein